MKRLLSAVACLLLLLTLFGCTEKTEEKEIKNTVEGNLKTYYEMADGTWSCDDISYPYRLEIKGRLHNAACDSVYVYLSNRSEISFDEAWRASGLSSNLDDYFPVEEAVLVEMRTE